MTWSNQNKSVPIVSGNNLSFGIIKNDEVIQLNLSFLSPDTFGNKGFKAGNIITVSGSSSNDGVYTVVEVTYGGLGLKISVNFAAEIEGANITITGDRAIYSKESKNNASYTNQIKSNASYNNQSKN